MRHLKSLLFVLLLVFNFGLTALAQDKIPIGEDDYVNQEIPMADQLRADGKIYVLLGVILMVFAGLVVYMVSLDRKITKLEKEITHSGH